MLEIYWSDYRMKIKMTYTFTSNYAESDKKKQ